MDGKPVVLHGLAKDTEFRTGDLVKLNPANERGGGSFYITETDSETNTVKLRLATFDEQLANGHLEVMKTLPDGSRMLVPVTPSQQ